MTIFQLLSVCEEDLAAGAYDGADLFTTLEKAKASAQRQVDEWHKGGEEPGESMTPALATALTWEEDESGWSAVHEPSMMRYLIMESMVDAA